MFQVNTHIGDTLIIDKGKKTITIDVETCIVISKFIITTYRLLYYTKASNVYCFSKWTMKEIWHNDKKF